MAAPQYTPASGEGTIVGNYIYMGGRWVKRSQDRQTYLPIQESIYSTPQNRVMRNTSGGYTVKNQAGVTQIPASAIPQNASPNIPQIANQYPNTQQQAAAIAAQDINRGGYLWSSPEDYEKDKIKAQRMGYNSPEEMRADQQNRQNYATNYMSNLGSGFETLLSAVTPKVQAADSEAVRSTADVSSFLQGLNRAPTTFGERLRNIQNVLGGGIGILGKTLGLGEGNISEVLRGNMPFSALKSPFYVSGETSNSQQGEIKGVLDRKESETVKNTKKQFEGDINKLKQDIEGGLQDQGINPTDNADYALITGPLEQANQKIMDEYVAGNKTQADAIAEAKQNTIDAYKEIYGNVIDQLRARIPRLQEAALTQKERLQSNLSTVQKRAIPIKNELRDLFGQSQRSLTKMGIRDKNQLRNIYSALGSAESSQFLDKLSNITTNLGRERANLTKEQGRRLGSINNQLIDYETKTKNAVADIDTKLEQDIADINNQVDVSTLEKEQQIQTAIQNANDKKTELDANLSNLKTQLAMADKESLLNQQSIIQQGDINKEIASIPYRYQQSAAAILNIPDAADIEIQRILSRGGGGFVGALERSKLISLAQQYPSIAKIVDLINNGELDLQGYQALKRGQYGF